MATNLEMTQPGSEERSERRVSSVAVPRPVGRQRLSILCLTALGVVYGDIGTSPLYAFRACFSSELGLPRTPANVYGVLSLIVWSLILIVTVKYILVIMRLDNRGEGGILALLALMLQKQRRGVLIGLGLFGAALLYGDGIITPAISVLSAVEGLEVAVPTLRHIVVPATLAILLLLFMGQRFGTARVGGVFGPIMLGWFATIGTLGGIEIARAPEILLAFNPWYVAQVFVHNRMAGFLVLGAVVLAVTGAEALYADMGHFGRRPIRLAWFAVVLPALLLNYLGQGALLLKNPAFAANPFYNLVPSWAIYPMVALATAAGVIASQALISGAFSLTMQAIQHGYSPRLRVEHTSLHEKGQIYMPQINWALMIACIGLVIGFGSSANLAAAYGIAVSLTMIVTTILFYFAVRRVWNWKPSTAVLICGTFLFIELAFFGANLLKIAHGGWFPLVVGVAVFTLMSTWKTGRQILGTRLRASSLPLKLFLEDIQRDPPHRVPGTAVFLYGNSEGTPLALLHNLKHNKVLHKRIVILTVVTDEAPHVSNSKRIQVDQLADGFFRVIG